MKRLLEKEQNLTSTLDRVCPGEAKRLKVGFSLYQKTYAICYICITVSSNDLE